MSLPPFQSETSLSGATTNLNGDRVVASSRRPDGTFRKEIKIRPGFLAVEDIGKFKTSKQVDAENRQKAKARVPGMVPGAGSTTKVQVTLHGAAKKNEKRREKRKEKEKEEVPDQWDSEDTPTAEEVVEKEDTPAAEEVEEKDGVRQEKEETKEDLEKRLKAIRKKMRQASQLKDAQNAGTTLLPEQQAKVGQLGEFQDELELLEGKLASLTV